jgi:hypothetical protein
MTYLLLETVRGALSNKVLNNSFQPFLVDLNTAIKENDKDVLEPVKNSITEFLEPSLDDHDDVIRFVLAFKKTIKTFGLENNKELVPFFETTVKQVLYDALNEYSEVDNKK